MANTIKDFALSLVAQGFSVIPVQSNKKPYWSWSEFQSRLPNPDEIASWPETVWGVAIVCGSASKCLAYDVDQKVIPVTEQKGAAQLVVKNLQERIPLVLEKLYVETTMNAGIHFIARCTSLEAFPRGDKLQPWDLESDDYWTETRGEGNYCIVAPSPGYVAYQKNSLLELPDLSIDEFNSFVDVIQNISNGIPQAKKNDLKKQQDRNRARKYEPIKIPGVVEDNYGWRIYDPTPWDDYNNKTCSEEVLRLLTSHNWTITGNNAKETFLCRPGKDSGTSATFGYYPKTFICFSSSTKFLPEKGYTPFQVRAILEFDGDIQKCVEKLIADSFGSKRDECFPFIHFTEQEVVDYLHNKLSRDVIYVHSEKSWYLWDGKAWQHDANEAIFDLIRRELKKLPPLPDGFKDDSASRKMGRLSDRCETNAGQTAIIDLLKSYPVISHSEIQWASNPILLPMKNCTLNLDSGKKEHSREDYFSDLIPYNYDPSATSPQWERFLSEILPDVEVQRYIQRILGYSLSGFTSEQVLFILYGLGANGKTIFSEIWKSLLGGDGVFATNISPSSLLEFRNKDGGPNPDIAALKGKRLALSVELPEGRLSEGLVKSITGSDSIIARRLYQDYQQFIPTHKLVLMSNHRPVIRGQDHGIWRRIVLIDFPVQIPPEMRRPDHLLLAELRAELPGILNWALEGYRAWKAGGLQPPPSVLESTQEYKLENDIIQQFFDDRLTLNPVGRVRASLLFQNFNSWQKSNGYDYQLNRIQFTRKMKEHGVKSDHGRDANYWLGYDIKADGLSGAESKILDDAIGDITVPSGNDLSLDDLLGYHNRHRDLPDRAVITTARRVVS
jgi:putative DNA primase/helicase